MLSVLLGQYGVCSQHYYYTTTTTTTTTNNNNNNNNNNLSPLLTMLETNYGLTPGCHDGGLSPIDSYDTYLRIVRHSKPMISDFV
jgi:hypothetical protein